MTAFASLINDTVHYYWTTYNRPPTGEELEFALTLEFNVEPK